MSFIEVDHTKKAYGDRKTISYLWSFTKGYRRFIYLSLFFLAASSLTGVASAKFLGELVEKGLIPKDMETILDLGRWILLMEFFAIALLYFGRRILARYALESVFRIRETLFHQTERLPMRFFDRQPLGRTVTRMTHDVESLEDFFQGTLARLLNAIFAITAVFSAMIFSNWRLGLLLTVAVVPSVAVTILFRKKIRFWNREMSRRNSAINARLSEFLNGLSVIRSFGVESWSKAQFDNRVLHKLEAGLMMNHLNSLSRPLVMFLSSLPLLSLIWFGGHSVAAGALSIGVFVTFVRYCERFSRPVSMLAQEVHVIQTAMAAAERVTTFLNESSEVDDLGEDGTRTPSIDGEIHFKNISMHYDPGKEILKNVNVRIPKGSVVGLAGETGSGKTTTVALLARLYDFQSGEILLDGQSIRNFKRAYLRSQLGYISQDVVVFKGSVLENLCMGEKLDQDFVVDCSRKTGLLNQLLESGKTLDSHLLDKGANLSVGERQLLALTRVLVKNPRILIMDEATANIDPVLEKRVHKAVEAVMDGRSCLIIAHRLDTLKSCDFLLVFREGEIVETGSHEELIQKRGYYWELQHKSHRQGLESGCVGRA